VSNLADLIMTRYVSSLDQLWGVMFLTQFIASSIMFTFVYTELKTLEEEIKIERKLRQRK
jgi:hypothetical protein